MAAEASAPEFSSIVPADYADKGWVKDVKDIDGLFKAYKDLGVSVIEEPQSQSWGLREFSVRESNGHVLRFCGHLQQSK